MEDQHSIEAARRLAAFLASEVERLPADHELRGTYERRVLSLREAADAQAALAAR